MNVYVLNASYEPVAVVDTYSSLIWTKRYYTCGDFELYAPADKKLLDVLTPGAFLKRDDDESVMIVEKITIQTDVENGDYFIFSGRSLESILARRVVGSQTIIQTDDVVQGLKELVSDWTSDISLTIDDSLQYPYDMASQITGDVLMNAVTDICTRFGIGFKMTLSDDSLLLTFYQGNEVDVIFSPEFDNLINSKYTYDITDYANYCKVLGEGVGTNRVGVHIYRPPQVLGINSRQIFVDAKDISQNGGDIPSYNYLPMLLEKGFEALAQHEITKTFEAEIIPDVSFHYKTDYNIGDIVTVTNEYGVTAKPRIVEIVESWDETGYTAIPTFDALEV